MFKLFCAGDSNRISTLDLISFLLNGLVSLTDVIIGFRSTSDVFFSFRVCEVVNSVSAGYRSAGVVFIFCENVTILKGMACRFESTRVLSILVGELDALEWDRCLIDLATRMARLNKIKSEYHLIHCYSALSNVQNYK